MKLIFLDIDGVLNGHQWMREAQSCTICRPCVLQLNRLIRATDARIVLSSAWRYMVHGKAMTATGFQYMLRTHGFVGHGRDLIIGLTLPDEVCPECAHDHRRSRARRQYKFNENGLCVCVKCDAEATRGRQITAWLRDHNLLKAQYVVLDDDDLGISAAGHPFVRTGAKRGLTRHAADKAIRILNAA